MLKFLFGERKTPAEVLRAHQRALVKAQRELDRERMKLEQQEKKLIQDIKKSAKSGQINASKMMAKDLVRTRKHIQKFYQMKTQLQTISFRIQSLRSNQQMAEAMRGATKVMKSMNTKMNLPIIQKVMMDFEKESNTLDMKEEIMNDTINDIVQTSDIEDEEEEEENVINQVLDEIGIDVNQQLLNTVPPNNIAMVNPLTSAKNTEVAIPEEILPVTASQDDEFRERLERLRRI